MTQAEQWYRKAADQGYRRAKNALARLSENTRPERFLAEVANAVREDHRWRVVFQNDKVVNSLPAEWLTWLPPLGKYYDDPHIWIVLKFEFSGSKIDSFIEMHGMTDLEMGKRLAAILFAEAPSFGFKPSAARKVTNYTHLTGRERLLEWGDEEPEQEAVRAAVKAALENLYPKLERMAVALRQLCKPGGPVAQPVRWVLPGGAALNGGGSGDVERSVACRPGVAVVVSGHSDGSPGLTPH